MRAGFVGIGEEEFVVADGGGGCGEGFDEEPGLFWGPGPCGAVGVEEVHF